MPIKTFSQAEQLTAADTNAYLANGGLVYITAGTLGTGGINVDNCFSSTYDGYRIIIAGVLSSSANGLTFKLRAGGSVSSTGYYYGGVYRLFTGTGGDETGANQTYWPAMTYGTAVPSFCFMDVWRPFQAATTSIASLKQNFDAGVYNNGYHSVTTSYDGFSLAALGGSLSAGTVTVYGYRKA